MKRTLFVCAGNNFSKGAFEFIKSLQDNEPVCVTGLFFNPIDYEHTISVGHLPTAGPDLLLREKELEAVDGNKALFALQCELHHIKYHIVENGGGWEKGILAKQSRFADLVVLSGMPSIFLHEALHSSECPVMIVPDNFAPLEHLIIAYDGSKESVFALKQLCYLLPQYTDLPTEIIYLNEVNTDMIPDIDILKDYTRLHFGSMNFEKLCFNAAKYFATWIAEKKNVLLVTGSFGRSPFSYVTKRSFVEQIIHDYKMPVFIAHGI